MKRPIVIITVGYIIGILMGLYCNISIALMYVIGFIIYSIIKKLKNRRKRNDNKLKLLSINRYLRYIKIVLTPKAIIIFILSSIISNFIVLKLNNKYNNLYSNIDDEVEIAGIVCSNKEEKQYKDVYKIKVESLNNSAKYKNTYLLLNTSNKNKIQYGDKIKLKGEFVKPTEQRNYKGFNYKEYLKTIKVYGTIKSKNVEVLKKENLNFVLIKSNNVFLKIKSNIENLYSNLGSSILLGIMLGYTENIETDIKESFSNNNISHILAVSGMHISYIIIGISLVLNRYAGKRKSKIITIIILIIYMFIIGFSPSIVRSGIMGILMLISFIIYRKNDVWTSIAISMLLILIYNPFLIQSVGLMLSYGGTIGIILFQKTIYMILQDMKLKSNKKVHKEKEIVTKIKNKLKEILSVTISAQIVIMPIIIIFFNKIGISFLVVNIFISLIIGPIVILGFIQIILSLISINLAKIISYFLNPIIKILILITNLGDKIPLNKIYVKTPDTYQILIYYIFIFLINYILKIYNLKYLNSSQKRIKNMINLTKYKFRLNKDKVKFSMTIIIVLILVINIIPKNLKVHFIDVGQGDSTLIVTPQNKTILIDGGGNENSEFDVGKQLLLPYLLDRKIKKIDYIIVSHFDEDHVRTDCFIL